MTVCSCVPANSSGGPRSLGRLTLCTPQKPHQTRARRDLSLTHHCVSDLCLFSPAEYVSLTICVMPATVTYLNVEISRLAYAMAKASNASSQAISAVSQELGQVREAVLENHAAIDYLF